MNSIANKKSKQNKKSFAFLALAVLVFFSIALVGYATDVDIGSSTATDEGLLEALTSENNTALDMLLLITLLSIAPSILIMMTCFTRIIVVLSFLRNAMGLQQSPPTQVLIGLSLFLTLFIMRPVVYEIYEVAYEPYTQEILTSGEALEAAEVPLKRFMLQQTSIESVDFFLRLADEEMPVDSMELPLDIVVPSFVTSELKYAFTLGLYLYMPFLIIDIVVSSTLMSMGMIMLPPAMISMPFKIMLFVLVDGWELIMGMLVRSFAVY